MAHITSADTTYPKALTAGLRPPRGGSWEDGRVISDIPISCAEKQDLCACNRIHVLQGVTEELRRMEDLVSLISMAVGVI